MSRFSKIASLAVSVTAVLVPTLMGAEEVTESTSVPEPSMAMLGGLCGIIFLLWRKK